MRVWGGARGQGVDHRRSRQSGGRQRSRIPRWDLKSLRPSGLSTLAWARGCIGECTVAASVCHLQLASDRDDTGSAEGLEMGGGGTRGRRVRGG